MEFTETLSEGLKRAYTVAVPAADIEQQRQKRLAEIAQQIRLPGFRPGKVPQNLVRRRYGEAIEAEILGESEQSALEQLMEGRGLRAASRPKVERSGDARAGLELRIELEIMPEIEVPDLAQISLIRLKAEPTEDAVDAALQRLADNQAVAEPIAEARGAEPGEMLRVDFVGRIDGAEFPGGKAEGVEMEVGGGGFIPGFTDGIAGMKPGETREVEVNFPDGYREAALAGKPATFSVTAHALSRKVAPALDAAFAERIGFEGLDELRTALRDEIRKSYDAQSRGHIKRDLLDELAKLAGFPAPEGMVEGEFEGIWQRVEAATKDGSLDDEDKGKDEATLRAEYRAIAERRVRLGLLLSEIGRANDIHVSDAELKQAAWREAMRHPGQSRELMELFQKNPRVMESLRGPILEEKVVDFVLDHATVAERAATPEELAAEPADPLA